MRTIRLLANILVVIAAVVYVGLFAGDRVSPVSAQRVSGARWEYCYVSPDGTSSRGADGKYESSATIYYFSYGPQRTEKVTGTGDASYSASTNAFSQAVAKLGRSGWELAAVAPNISVSDQPVPYFKRQQ